MSDDAGLHENDIGAVIEITINEDGSAKDISDASTKQIKFIKPNGSSVSKDASFSDDGSDGKVRYTTVDGDLVPSGVWACRVYLVLSGGWTGHTSKTTFDVFPV